MNKHANTSLIKQEAKRLGFDFCGISKADFLEEEAPRLEAWLNKGMQGSMKYMENHFDKRLDPRLLLPGAKSVISLMLNYYPAQQQNKNSFYKISKYAYGRDYHKVIKKKLKQFVGFIQKEIGEVSYKMCVDSAPVMDKAWAKKSGLGWIGKHTNLINKKNGSFYFIAELILDIELEYDGPIKDYCGTCTKCIDACPTGAITDPYVVDGSKCISYFTIELKENIPDSYKGKFKDWVFGCDICQDVCPWNSFSTQHQEPLFNSSLEFLNMNKEEWETISEETFNKVFMGSAVKRTKYSGLKRNVKFIRDT